MNVPDFVSKKVIFKQQQNIALFEKIIWGISNGKKINL